MSWYLPKNETELKRILNCFKNAENHSYNDLDFVCRALGHSNGYEGLKNFWKNNPLAKLDTEIYIHLNLNTKAVCLYEQSSEVVDFCSLTEGVVTSVALAKNRSSLGKELTTELLELLQENYLINSTFSFSENNKSDMLLRPTHWDTYATFDVFRYGNKIKQIKDNIGVSFFDHDNAKKYQTEYSSNIKSPKSFSNFQDRNENSEQILIHLIKKDSFLINVYDKNEYLEYQICQPSRSELFHHLERMHFGKDKVEIIHFV